MSFERKISFTFLKFINEIIYLEFYLDGIIKLIEAQSKEVDNVGIWKSFTDTIITEQNSLLSKIIHIYIITVFETFNKEFFKELNQQKNLNRSNFSITPSKIVSFFQYNFKIDIQIEFKSWMNLKENICRRHVITHNMGKIDQKYIDCVNENKGLKGKIIGKDIIHDLQYVKKSKKNVGNFMIFTFKRISQYFSLKNIKKIVYDLAEKNFEDINPNLLDDVNV